MMPLYDVYNHVHECTNIEDKSPIMRSMFFLSGILLALGRENCMGGCGL